MLGTTHEDLSTFYCWLRYQVATEAVCLSEMVSGC